MTEYNLIRKKLNQKTIYLPLKNIYALTSELSVPKLEVNCRIRSTHITI